MSDDTKRVCAICQRECEPHERHCHGCGRPFEDKGKRPKKSDAGDAEREPKTDPPPRHVPGRR